MTLPAGRYGRPELRLAELWTLKGVAALIVGKNGGSMSPAALEAALRSTSLDLGKPGRDRRPLGGRGPVLLCHGWPLRGVKIP